MCHFVGKQIIYLRNAFIISVSVHWPSEHIQCPCEGPWSWRCSLFAVKKKVVLCLCKFFSAIKDICVWPHHRQSCMIRPKPHANHFYGRDQKSYFGLSCLYVNLQLLLLNVHRTPQRKYVVKPIEGWGFSSDRRGILDQVHCCKHCFLFELIQLPTFLRKRFTSMFILWRLASTSHSWWRLFTAT